MKFTEEDLKNLFGRLEKGTDHSCGEKVETVEVGSLEVLDEQVIQILRENNPGLEGGGQEGSIRHRHYLGSMMGADWFRGYPPVQNNCVRVSTHPKFGAFIMWNIDDKGHVSKV